MIDSEDILGFVTILGLCIIGATIIWAIGININEDKKVHKVNGNCIVYNEKLYCLKGVINNE